MGGHYNGRRGIDATRDTPSMAIRKEHGMVKLFPSLVLAPSIFLRIADRVLRMLRWRESRGCKASWSVYPGISCSSFFSPSARCSSWARRIRTIVFDNGPQTPFKRTISCPAHLTAKRNPIRAKANSRNWRSPRERPFVSSISRVPVWSTTPAVREQTSPPTGSAPRLFPDASTASPDVFQISRSSGT